MSCDTAFIPVPANGGVLVRLSNGPRSITEDEQRPRTGHVVMVGGGVRWLRLGEHVTFEPTGAMFYDQGLAVVSQRGIIAHQPELIDASVCENGCFGNGVCSHCPPVSVRWDRTLPPRIDGLS